MTDIVDLVTRAAAGERRALGRLLTTIERGGAGADEISELTLGNEPTAHVVGITGAPGSGKSTLTGCLLALFVGAESTPAVLAVDPSSPLTGGAILGDRIRMDPRADGRAFIRSMATRGHQGGLALAVPGAIRLFDTCGYSPLIVETVGVGQVEVDVARAADTTVVVVSPGMGDAVQANKAGLLEVADVLVVNKADRPGAADTRRDLELMLDLGHVSGLEQGWRPEIIMTTASEGTGSTDAWAAIERHLAHLEATGQRARRRDERIRQEVRDRTDQLLTAASASYLATQPSELVDAIARRRSPASAAAALVSDLMHPDPGVF